MGSGDAWAAPSLIRGCLFSFFNLICLPVSQYCFVQPLRVSRVGNIITECFFHTSRYTQHQQVDVSSTDLLCISMKTSNWKPVMSRIAIRVVSATACSRLPNHFILFNLSKVRHI